jgi:uncharacterized protein (DUF885 family)
MHQFIFLKIIFMKRHFNNSNHKIVCLSLVAIFFTLNVFAQENLDLRLTKLRLNMKGKSETEKLTLFGRAFSEYMMEAYPEMGTFFGNKTYDDQWEDQSLAALEKRQIHLHQFWDLHQSIDRSQLGSPDKINLDLLRVYISNDLDSRKFAGHLMPIDQLHGQHRMIISVISGTSITSDHDLKNFQSRLNKIPLFIDQTIALMDRGLQLKVTAPQTTVTGVPEQLRNILGTEAEKSVFFKPLENYLPIANEQDRKVIIAATSKIITEKVNPAFKKLLDYMEKTYIPNARKSIALTDLPDGDAWYNHRIQVMTTTQLTHQEIHALGLREVKRISAQMDSAMRATGFKGSSGEFMKFLRTDPQFFYNDATQLIDGYRSIAKRIDLELPKYFRKLPRLTYGIQPIPEYDAKFQTTAYYQGGSTRAGRAGIFFANTYDLKSRPKWEMEALTLHEAVPGHHLEQSLTDELENVPEFRKMFGSTAYVEGWGLYAESLGKEMGLYKDAYSSFGHFTYEMWRAVRLVVDTGIHGMGWTRQQAINYFMANTPKTEHDIAVEVDRYIAMPGQALAYKVGELKIKELRQKAESELGEKFDIRDFHDAILSDGPLPLSMLEQKITDWIVSVKN